MLFRRYALIFIIWIIRVINKYWGKQNRQRKYLKIHVYIPFFIITAIRTELRPYVSIMINTVSSLISIGSPHIHRPFVQGTVLGPIANPVILFNNLLDKKDFPDLCGPATVATAILISWWILFYSLCSWKYQ